MGADIHATLGWIKQYQVNQRPEYTEAIAGAHLKVLQLNRQCLREDIHLESLDRDKIELPSYYPLFSWLAGVRRANEKSLVDINQRRKQTDDFIDWMNEDLSGDELGYPYWSLVDLSDTHDIGEHSRIIYLTEELTNFNYNQVMEYENVEGRNPEHNLHNGETYRQVFESTGWFELLDHLRQEKAQFVIFGFDS